MAASQACCAASPAWRKKAPSFQQFGQPSLARTWDAAACAGKRPRPRNFAIPCPTPPQGRTRRGGKRKADCGELQRSHCTPRPTSAQVAPQIRPRSATVLNKLSYAIALVSDQLLLHFPASFLLCFISFCICSVPALLSHTPAPLRYHPRTPNTSKDDTCGARAHALSDWRLKPAP